MERLPRRIDPSKLAQTGRKATPAGRAHGDDETTGIRCRLDELLTERGMTLTQLSKLVDLSIVNLSVLKNDRAKAIRFSTLHAICVALECDVGDLLAIE